MVAAHEGRADRGERAILSDVFTGPGYDETEVSAALRESPFAGKHLDDEAVIETVAQALIDERVVGWYRGRGEYGPRALGHRTILVNPTKREINETVNRRLRRTEFMPFAPVVLEECYPGIFESPKLNGARFAGSFMTITLRVRPAWRRRIQGVVHVDGTARPQIIRKSDDPMYYGVVRRFYERTGIGCVVNTSFNIHEEPIVNTPRDALRAFAQGAVDLLVMENYVVSRERTVRDTAEIRERSTDEGWDSIRESVETGV